MMSSQISKPDSSAAIVINVMSRSRRSSDNGIYDETLVDHVVSPDTLSTACYFTPWGIFCTPCIGFNIISENEAAVILLWGKYIGTYLEPGLYFINPWATEIRKVSTALQTIDLPEVKVADKRGTPIQLSAIVTFHVQSPRRALLDVEHYTKFLMDQATAVLKGVASQYVYDSSDPEEPSLKSEASLISQSLVDALGKRVDVAGVLIESFELTDLAYASEIAQSMLVRQQAEAKLDARKIIVEGAVDIAVNALEGLQKRGIELTSEAQADLVTGLMVTVCSEGPVVPTLKV